MWLSFFQRKSAPIKLNLGCGYHRKAGFINVDSSAECRPDQVFDLEKKKWPWKTNSVDEVIFYHSLEHMGAAPAVFLNIMKELYRVCCDGAQILIHVPHPRSDHYWGDPTHVRPITPDMLALFNREFNDQWAANRISNTCLAHYLGVDFRVIEQAATLEEPYYAALSNGTLSEAELATLLRERNNIASEWKIRLKVVKPASLIN